MMNVRKFIFLIFSLLLVSFSSCSFLDSDEDSSSEGILSSSKILSGKVLVGGEVSSSKLSSSRTILPDFPSSNLTYSVFASSDGGKTKSFVATVSSDKSFSLIISTDGTYAIYAEISDSSGKVVYKGNSETLTVSNGAISKNGKTTTEIGTITAKPVQSGSGNAAISVDLTSAAEIQSVKAEWQKSDSSAQETFTKSISADSDRTFTLYLSDSSNTNESISSGTYSLSLFFYCDSSSSVEVYRISESVLVYDNLTSSSFVGNASYISGNSIKITSSMIDGTAYVAGTSPSTLKSNSNGENGTYYAPFSSISDALAKVESSGSGTMTIYLDGTFSLSDALSLSVDSGKTLNIYGVASAEKSVVTNSNGSGISVASGSKVNLKNLSVKSCTSSGITNAGTLTLENCVISGNGSSSASGGGIYNSGTLTVSSCTISENTAESGGGIYKSNSGAITIQDSEITGNKASSGGGIGVYTTLATEGDISLGGKVNISENTSLDGTAASNVLTTSYFKLAVASAFDSDSKIGISLSSALSLGKTRTITSGWKTYNSSTDASTVFSSDNDSYSVSTNSDGEVILSNTISGTAVYVSSSGSDGNKGTKTAPFATIQYAVDAIASVNDGTTEYTIYLLSDITAKNYTDGQESFIDISPSSSLNLAIEPSDISQATINANNNLGSTSHRYRVLNIGENATVTLKNLTLTGGYISGSGGGICNEGTLTLTDCTVSGNTGTTAGGIYTTGTLFMEGGKISGNTATTNNGGGIQSYSASGKVFLKNVSITGNTATKGNGGGIAISSAKFLALESCTITGNAASAGSGGGIYIAGGLSLFGAIDVSDNTASSYGKNICWANDSNSKTISIGTETESTTLGGKSVTTSALSVASGKSICATITPASSSNDTSTTYVAGTALIKSASSSSSLSDFAGLFEVDDDDTTDTRTWYIDDDGKLQKKGDSSGSLTVKISDTISLSLSSSSLSTTGATTLTLTATANGTATAITSANTKVSLYNGGVLYADSSVTTSVSANNTIKVSEAVAPGGYQLLVTFTYDGVDYQATFGLTAEDED